jgi:hypothetical protein
MGKTPSRNIAIMDPFMPDNIALHIVALLIYGSLGYVIALAITRRRLLK